jgi:hypothetical protein
VVLTVTPGFGGEAVSGTEALLQRAARLLRADDVDGVAEHDGGTTYLDVTGQLTPELRETRDRPGDAGYQRLLTFESPTGGFNWWGDA